MFLLPQGCPARVSSLAGTSKREVVRSSSKSRKRSLGLRVLSYFQYINKTISRIQNSDNQQGKELLRFVGDPAASFYPANKQRKPSWTYPRRHKGIKPRCHRTAASWSAVCPQLASGLSAATWALRSCRGWIEDLINHSGFSMAFSNLVSIVFQHNFKFHVHFLKYWHLSSGF